MNKCTKEKHINWEEYKRLKKENYLDKQIARYFGMSLSTLSNKKRKYKHLLE